LGFSKSGVQWEWLTMCGAVDPAENQKRKKRKKRKEKDVV
jgi:hypothetical protein